MSTTRTALLAVTTAAAAQTAGTPFTVTVTGKASDGTTTIAGYVGTVHFTSGDPKAVLPADAALASGTATFTVTANTPGAATFTVTDLTAGVTGSVTVTVANVAAGIGFGVLVATANTGAVLAPVLIRVLDAAGNLVAAATNAVTVSLHGSPAGVTLGGTLTRNAVGGVATFNDLTVSFGGVYQLDAAASGLVGATSNYFSIIPSGMGMASQLAFGVQPSAAGAGAAISPAVTVRLLDANGNLVLSAVNAVTVALTAAGGATLGGTLTQSAVNGVATFPGLTVDKISTYTLTATSSGLTSAVSSSFAITGFGSATKLGFGQQPTDTASGAAVTPSVTVLVQDAGGNTVSSSTAAVILALTTPGLATLGGTLTRNAVAGVATFPGLTVDLSGTYTLTATSAGLTNAASSSFAVTFTPALLGSGLKLWLDATQPLYQDAARTTLATADAAPVKAGTDLSGNGNHPTNAGATCQLKLAILPNGNRAFFPNGSYLTIPSFMDASFDSSFTIIAINYAVIATPGDGTLKIFLGGNGHLNYERYPYASVFSTNPLQSPGYNSGTVLFDWPVNLGVQAFGVESQRFDGTNLISRLNGVERVYGAGPTLGERSTLFWGAAVGGVLSYPGYCVDLLILNRCLTVAEIRNVETYYYALRGIAAPTKIVACDGNSITSSIKATLGYTYPARLKAALGATWGVLNYGSAGIRTYDLTARYATTVAKSYDASKTKNIAVLQEFFNDYLGGAPLATCKTHWQAYVAAARAAGQLTVSTTALPSTNAVVPGGYEADRQLFNTWMRANVPGVAGDALADVGASGNGIGSAGDSDGANYDADKVHLNDAGYAVWVPLVQTAVLSL